MIVPSDKSKAFLRESALNYHHQLLDDPEALKYLTEDRNITSEAIVHFGLGVVRDPVVGHETYRNRISFPYVTVTGVTSIRFRYLGDAKADKVSKFLSLTGDSARLYNVTALTNESRVFICEGETDTITCWMAGLPAVGVPGATAFRPVFSRIFRNREVTVLADNDDSGEGKKFADEIHGHLGGCDVILMDRGHDVSSYATEHGLDKLREKVGL